MRAAIMARTVSTARFSRGAAPNSRSQHFMWRARLAKSVSTKSDGSEDALVRLKSRMSIKLPLLSKSESGRSSAMRPT